MQDAFWSGIRNIGTFRGNSAFGSWIYRIVLNAAYQKLRGRARRRNEIPLDEVLPVFDERGQHAHSIADWSTAVDDPTVQSELRTALEAAIAEVPVAHRAIVLLHDVEGVPMAEVAVSLGHHARGGEDSRAPRPAPAPQMSDEFHVRSGGGVNFGASLACGKELKRTNDGAVV